MSAYDEVNPEAASDPALAKALNLRLQVAPSGYAAASWRDLFMAAFRHRPHDYDYADLDRWLCAYAREHQGSFGYFAIIEPGVGASKRENKKRLEEALFKHANRFRFAAIVIEDAGFKGVALRGVLRMLGILSGKRHPEAFLPRIEDAVRWMHGIYSVTQGPRPTEGEIASAVFAFRGEYQRRIA